MRILLVCERSYMCDAIIRGLYESGHEVRELWCEHNPAKMRSRSSLRFITNNPRCTGTQVQKHNIRIRCVGGEQRKNLISLLDEIEPLDMLISAGTHIIFSEKFLARFEGRAFNFHPSMLPRYRGPRPSFAMIFEGNLDKYGGLTLHSLSPEIDAGDIVAQRQVPRSHYRNAMAWNMALADAIYDFTKFELNEFLNGNIKAKAQDENIASYHALRAEELNIARDWSLAKTMDFMKQGYGIYTKTLARIENASGTHSDFAVCGIPTKLGDPSGLPAVVYRTAVEFDILDARIRLKRETRLQRAANKLDRYRTLLTGR